MEDYYKVSLEPFLLQAEQTQLPQSFLKAEMLQPPCHLCDSTLVLLQQLYIFLVLGPLGLGTVLQVGSHKDRVWRDNHLHCPAGHTYSPGCSWLSRLQAHTAGSGTSFCSLLHTSPSPWGCSCSSLMILAHVLRHQVLV